MALPVLDGNQSATTLSSVVTGGEHIVAHSVVSLGANAIANITSAVSGSVVSVSNFPASQSTTFGAVTGSVSVLNFPSTQTIAGTVTANGGDFASKNTDQPSSAIQLGYMTGGGDFLKVNEDGNCFPVRIFTSDGSVGLAEAFIPISGTVTANNLSQDIYDAANDRRLTRSALHLSIGDGEWLEVGGSNGSENPLPISGNVTANNPNGALTTRFGSVATANLSQITSAVTNTSRKYLLAQNISAGTVTIGIGFSPTTTQGIQLTAGGGLTFDAFCPTGAVYWLGAVTGAAFTILEG